MCVVGARPQFVKQAPLSKALSGHDCVILHTGQHYDYVMSEVFFRELGIPKPKYNLGVGSGSHAEQTAKMLVGIEKVLVKEKPDVVVVHGDTNSTLAGALAAAKLGAKVAHIEAGMRSFNREMPEELNRVLADHASDALFCPTKTAVNNLKNEGINSGIYMEGDVMVDALLLAKKAAKRNSSALGMLGIEKQGYVLATIHRQGNTDNEKNLRGIFKGLAGSKETVVLPAHPRLEKMLKKFGMMKKISAAGNIILTRPASYIDFISLEMNAKKILTDSGGVQKEAYILGIPCVTARNETEWVETVENGWNVLAGADSGKIARALSEFEPKRKRRPVFGKKGAAKRIASRLKMLYG